MDDADLFGDFEDPPILDDKDSCAPAEHKDESLEKVLDDLMLPEETSKDLFSAKKKKKC